MTPDQKFARWIKYSCIAFVMVFAYFLVADLAMPLTPQAMATRNITKISPRINGQISHIFVSNNQMVQQGDVLFTIDPRPYQLAVEQAQLNYERTAQNNAQLDASIAAADANVTASTIIADQKQREANRLDTLFNRNGTSQQLRDDAKSAAVAAKANLLAAKAQLKELQVSRGEHDDNNVNLRVALNQLEQAKLNLSYTRVVAERDGVITNLQLEIGSYAIAGTPLIALVATDVDIIADFREKSLRHLASNNRALIAFDSKPGQIFQAYVRSQDAGVSAGQFDANGRLATPTESNRWVRDAQRMRLHLAIDDGSGLDLPSGARATVQLLPENALFAWFATLQIRFVSTLHYIY
ncbi:HlyD family secretion protein [Vibrio aestuarianus]|uniref:Secretion protein n=1 Tax=Vibrio aestuarianus TaxID=28171 RepID=A0A7X6NC10_9VIBR|nr:HlyD family secretion protein [Vibrio aestuarianus]KOE88488.1 hemolysin D [Vibrio alginolyticus]MDE1214680.1 HlyD family secretion protein [Vibrio aestuarianus]MDE1218829.1 HlyD family secretion protein [Vibrio aestuarianus]MDE1229832.1 HlyD family secretion protein [Vibrio aestuarianus]MDE1241069.1 HlyD family secretion protein [Vibrio aestuarianus]